MERYVLALDRLLHRDRGDHGTYGVVVTRFGHAKDRDDRVSDVLVDDAAAAMDLARERRKVRAEDRAKLLGIEALAECGRAGDVGLEDGDDATLGDARR